MYYGHIVFPEILEEPAPCSDKESPWVAVGMARVDFGIAALLIV